MVWLILFKDLWKKKIGFVYGLTAYYNKIAVDFSNMSQHF